MLVMPLAAAVARAWVGVVESIAATEALVEDQVKVTPEITFNSVSRAMARYIRRNPSDVIVKVSGAATTAESKVTSIRVIGVSTATFDTPTVDPLVARICVVPIDSALATPVEALIEATAGCVDDQVKVGCVAIAFPRPSTACAVKVKPPLT